MIVNSQLFYLTPARYSVIENKKFMMIFSRIQRNMCIPILKMKLSPGKYGGYTKRVSPVALQITEENAIKCIGDPTLSFKLPFGAHCRAWVMYPFCTDISMIFALKISPLSSQLVDVIPTIQISTHINLIKYQKSSTP